jgi:hypothetical protein
LATKATMCLVSRQCMPSMGRDLRWFPNVSIAMMYRKGESGSPCLTPVFMWIGLVCLSLMMTLAVVDWYMSLILSINCEGNPFASRGFRFQKFFAECAASWLL